MGWIAGYEETFKTMSRKDIPSKNVYIILMYLNQRYHFRIFITQEITDIHTFFQL